MLYVLNSEWHKTVTVRKTDIYIIANPVVFHMFVFALKAELVSCSDQFHIEIVEPNYLC